MRTAVDWAVPARLLTDPYAVGNLGRHRAADRAVGADALADRDLCRGGRRPGGSPADAGQRQRPQRPKTAGDEAGAAQESPAVEPAICLAGESTIRVTDPATQIDADETIDRASGQSGR